MNNTDVKVFFYGLFMDKGLLAEKGLHPSTPRHAFVDGYRLQIGRRATLVPDPIGRAFGVVMTIASEEAAALYSDESVSDYIPETITAIFSDGDSEPAVSYNLPKDQLEGTNAAYANSLLRLATKLGFPNEYLEEIKGFSGASDG